MASTSGATGEFVWIFNGDGGRFPAAVFTNLREAELWIARTACSGVLTRYPLNQSAYDWCLAEGYFSPHTQEQKEPLFLQRFSHAAQEHYHYTKGVESGKEDSCEPTAAAGQGKAQLRGNSSCPG